MILDAVDTPVCNIFDKINTKAVREAVKAHVTASALPEEEAMLEAYEMIFESVVWNSKTQKQTNYISVDPLKRMLSIGFPLNNNGVDMVALFYPLEFSEFGVEIKPVGYLFTLLLYPPDGESHKITHKISARLLPNVDTATHHFNRIMQVSPGIKEGVIGNVLSHNMAPTLSDIVLAVEEEEDTL
ncbi:gp8 [Brochothrix phage A9]|uniref:Gp8 n=1 Tax=Brochothrix phage A9 TaxID=857312 RepID=D9J0F5_9CAUD|nr:gp8 [Brochothrix phage A9]ADJ53050.1 gp8 [Brochothrix phage A9]